MTKQETLKVLVETHFPDSKEIDTCPEEGWQSDLEPCRVNRENWNLLQQIVNRIKLRWAINSFDSYKSAGPDLIIPAFLQQGIDVLSSLLCNTFRACLALGHIPMAWRKARVTFIPKPGKPSYTKKTLERLVERHIRNDVLEKILYTLTNMPINRTNQLIQR